MIIQELEGEVAAHDSCREDFERAEQLWRTRATAWRTSFASTRRASRTCRADRRTPTSKPNGFAVAPRREAERTRIKRAIERVRGRLRHRRRRAPAHRAAHRPALPPVLGLAPEGGERAVELRRAGRGVRVSLHLARVELPLLLAAAVLPQPARRDGARAGQAGRTECEPAAARYTFTRIARHDVRTGTSPGSPSEGRR